MEPRVREIPLRSGGQESFVETETFEVGLEVWVGVPKMEIKGKETESWDLESFGSFIEDKAIRQSHWFSRKKAKRKTRDVLRTVVFFPK